MAKTYTLAEISTLIGGQVRGDANCIIHGIAALDVAQEGQLSFLNDSRYRKLLKQTNASAVILPEVEAEHCSANMIFSTNPHLGYAKVAELFQYQSTVPTGIHSTVVVGEDCNIHPSASIGPNCVIGNHAVIGEGTQLQPGCVIGEYAQVGNYCYLWPNVNIYHHVKIGDYAILHSGAVIGSDGFGNVKDEKGIWRKIPQLGSVVIGNYVEVGANTTIDRGSVKDTVIEDHVKLDNLIQIGHNVFIGSNTAMAACTGVAGSTRIGRNCMIGGGSRIADHLEIADKVILLGSSMVAQSIKSAGIYGSGVPLMPRRELLKNAVRFCELDKIAKRISKLEQLEHE